MPADDMWGTAISDADPTKAASPRPRIRSVVTAISIFVMVIITIMIMIGLVVGIAAGIGESISNSTRHLPNPQPGPPIVTPSAHSQQYRLTEMAVVVRK